MKIKIIYKDYTIQELSDEQLTEASGLFQKDERNHFELIKGVFTKYLIDTKNFMSSNKKQDLYIFIYYYQKSNTRGDSITNSDFLDPLMFEQGGSMLPGPWDKKRVVDNNKNLPTGSMMAGTWFTLVPYEIKNTILRISINNNDVIQFSKRWNTLLWLEPIWENIEYYKIDVNNLMLEDMIISLIAKMQQFESEIEIQEDLQLPRPIFQDVLQILEKQTQQENNTEENIQD